MTTFPVTTEIDTAIGLQFVNNSEQIFDHYENYTCKGNLLFGKVINGLPELVVCFDLLGIDAFRFHDTSGTYNRVNLADLWSMNMHECLNPEDIDNIVIPGSIALSEYFSYGYETLGYAFFCSLHPKLANVLDNPGLLALSVGYEKRFSSIGIEDCKREDIVQQLTGLTGIRPRHMKRLSKVHLGCHLPGRIASLIESILLWDSAAVQSKATKEDAIISKLLNHQTAWTYEGMLYVYAIINSGVPLTRSRRERVREYNRQGAGLLGKLRKLARLMDELEELPKVVRYRLKAFSTNPESVNPGLLEKMLRLDHFLLISDIKKLSVKHWLPLVSDADIAEASFPSDERFRHLNSLGEIRLHAAVVGNCLWSNSYVSSIVDGTREIYVYHAKCVATIAVSRRTLEIQELEVRVGVFEIDDLRYILDWLERGIRRLKKTTAIRVPSYMSRLQQID